MGKPNVATKLYRAKSYYDRAIDDMESYLRKFADFDVSVFYQQSDGFVVANDMTNVSLNYCIEIIRENGKLTYDDYFEGRI